MINKQQKANSVTPLTYSPLNPVKTKKANSLQIDTHRRNTITPEDPSTLLSTGNNSPTKLQILNKNLMSPEKVLLPTLSPKNKKRLSKPIENSFSTEVGKFVLKSPIMSKKQIFSPKKQESGFQYAKSTLKVYIN
jgi:hypothetical protein